MRRISDLSFRGRSGLRGQVARTTPHRGFSHLNGFFLASIPNVLFGIAEHISRGDSATSPSKAIRQTTNPRGYFGSASPFESDKNRQQATSGYTGAKENAPLKSIDTHSNISRKLCSLRKGKGEREAGDD